MLPKPFATVRKHPKQERSQATVEAILTATTRILTEQGYAQFTTNRVAELAGVSVGSLYQYFPNKEALIVALMEHHTNAMAQLAQQHLEGLEARRSVMDVLQQLIKAALAAHAVNPRLHHVLNEQMPRSEAMRQADDVQMEAMLRSFLAPRKDQLQPQNLDLTVFILARTIKTLIHGALLDRPELLKNGELEQEIMTMLSAYLVKR
jgi:AcrR family transcriptional regulator